MGQICIFDLLRFFKVAQGSCELGQQVALVGLERATGECRPRKARKEESLETKVIQLEY